MDASLSFLARPVDVENSKLPSSSSIFSRCLTNTEQELYDLINRDYADFILVSTKLSGVGGKVSHLREPMSRCVRSTGAFRRVALFDAVSTNSQPPTYVYPVKKSFFGTGTLTVP